MVIYPFTTPIILDVPTFVSYGGKTGTFAPAQLQSSFLIAEMRATRYIGTLLLPQTVTGTFPFMGQKRLHTDFGYVNSILAVDVVSKNIFTRCDLVHNTGCVFLYEDTFGYLDVQSVLTACNLAYLGSYGLPYPSFPPTVPQIYDFMSPYQFNITYNAGLPTGVASMPGILEALTIAAQIDLNEKDPGNAGMNEGVGDVAISEFSDFGYRGYREKRKDSALKRTAFGGSAKANYAASLIDISVKKARPAMRM